MRSSTSSSLEVAAGIARYLGSSSIVAANYKWQSVKMGMSGNVDCLVTGFTMKLISTSVQTMLQTHVQTRKLKAKNGFFSIYLSPQPEHTMQAIDRRVHDVIRTGHDFGQTRLHFCPSEPKSYEAIDQQPLSVNDTETCDKSRRVGPA